MNILNNLRKNALMRKLLPKSPLQSKADDEANKVKNEVIDSMKEGDAVEMMKCTIKKCSEEEVHAEEKMKEQVSTEHVHEATSIDKQLREDDVSNSDTKDSDTKMEFDSSVSESPMVDTARDAKRIASKENQEFTRFQQQVLTMRIRKRRHHGRQEHATKSRFAGKEAMSRAPHVGHSKRMKITQPAKKPMLM